ncbi:nitrile hydratase subunit beta [Nocardioides endophyticus]|uniref:Nitrile hydratase subunit beta n=2 Tax=Nocardioides endophyticus TaxID=1353775 RepID=A0ABP8Y5A6_9ACTN
MIGVHDVGGFHYPGPIDTVDEAVFHDDWEGRTMAMLLVVGPQGSWSLDEFRYEIELMPPAEYLQTAYYVHWLESLEKLCVREGWFSSEELSQRQAMVRRGEPLPEPPEPDPDKAKAQSEAAWRIAYHGVGQRRPDLPRSFKIGDRVRARQRSHAGHTRLPRFAWNKPGVICGYSGTHPLPDTIYNRRGDNPEPVFAVRFEGVDLWGDGAEPGTSLTIDLWQSYMDHDNSGSDVERDEKEARG